ncbi:MAG TPA: LytR C-terminal domain-containing protein [Mycobacteriales bacterium]|nr:LytR C-terminal domain-containing protein [Mycobacteriales bacterium]
MTIPGRGDLSPRRKHRNWRRRLGVVLAVLLVAGGGYVGYRQLRGGGTKQPEVLPPCPIARATAAAATRQRIIVRNATLRTGLANDVSHQLRQRHFRVGKPGNTLFRGKGVATVRYSPDRSQAARLVAAQFSGATLVAVAGSRVLEVDVGPRFRALVPVAAAQAADRAILSFSSPAPSATSSPACAPPAPRPAP